MLKNCIEQLIQGKDLSEKDTFSAAMEMMNSADPAQTAAFLALLRAKKETAQELLGLVRALRSQARTLILDRPVLDIVGSGGDGAGTVNLSTGSALLAAFCGIPVVKHGNRAVSSQSGSADVLEAMGYNIHLTPEELQESIRKTAFGFCFAPDYHPALQKVRPIRSGLKIPTAFNLIGPLLNPAGIDHMQIGVFDPKLVQPIAEVLFQLGTKRSLVFHGNGTDELTCMGPMDAILVTQDGLETIRIEPETYGLKKCTLDDLKGGDAALNAAILKKALSGIPTSITDTLILNAGVALFLYGPARTIDEGVQIVREKLLGKKKSLKEAIRRNPFAIIAEVKRKSPSAGHIGEIPDSAERASLYVKGGAAAISVLTAEAFGGSIEDLKKVSKTLAHTSVPILRKDFLTEPKQIQEAAEAGADAVLLIVAYLGDRTKEMVLEARKFGLEALVEIHNEAELAIALDSGAEIIGVNQRNLKDFTMHPEIYAEVIEKIPSYLVRIAESGIRTPEDAEHVRNLGFEAILVGEMLTRAEDPLAFLSTLRMCHAR